MIKSLFEKKERLKHFYKTAFAVAVVLFVIVHFFSMADAAQVYPLGDADFNNTINAADARQILRESAGLE